jgi:UDPglucose--hexose-1-phosphate uridylyltransferase
MAESRQIIITWDRHTNHFHLYITIVPRVSRAADLGIGSGVFIDTSLPEESAKFR